MHASLCPASSFLLWHGIRIRTKEPITAAYATAIAEDLHRTDELILAQLSTSLSLSNDEILHHFNNETFWSGLSLKSIDPKFLDVLPAYPDLLSTLGTAVKVAFPSSLFNQHNEMIYMWSGYKKN